MERPRFQDQAQKIDNTPPKPQKQEEVLASRVYQDPLLQGQLASHFDKVLVNAMAQQRIALANGREGEALYLSGVIANCYDTIANVTGKAPEE